jgi:hypothetical protein
VPTAPAGAEDIEGDIMVLIDNCQNTPRETTQPLQGIVGASAGPRSIQIQHPLQPSREYKIAHVVVFEDNQRDAKAASFCCWPIFSSVGAGGARQRPTKSKIASPPKRIETTAVIVVVTPDPKMKPPEVRLPVGSLPHSH